MDGTATFPPTTPTLVSPTGPTPATASAPAGTKRKRESPLKFYAVRIGRKPGIYHSWADCLEQVKGFPKAAFKSFLSLTDAQAYLQDESAVTAASGRAVGSGSLGTKFYGVQRGRRPGVYATWPEALEQITGWKNPRYRGFKTQAEAEEFVRETPSNGNALTTKADTVETSEPSSKKTKSTKSRKSGGGVKEETTPPPGVNAAQQEQDEYVPGEGPLPEGAQDNFDSTIVLDHSLGTARYKTAAELAQTKYQAVSPVPTAPIKIYTDGSALGNGQMGAVAGVGVYFGPRDRRNISEPLAGTKQTNQRAELTALQRALDVAPKDRRVIIISDSQYAIRCVTQWFLSWRRSGWYNAAGKPVENKDLVVKIIDALEERRRLNAHREQDTAEDSLAWSTSTSMHSDGTDAAGSSSTDDKDKKDSQHLSYWAKGPGGVLFQWVKGHAKDEGNNGADELAVQGATMARELLQQDEEC